MLKKKKKQGWKNKRSRRRVKVNKSNYELEQERLDRDAFIQQMAEVEDSSKEFENPAFMYNPNNGSIYIMEKEYFDILNTEMNNA